MDRKVVGSVEDDIFWPIMANDAAINGGTLPTEEDVLSFLLQRRQSQSLMSSDSSYLRGRMLYDHLKKTNPFESPAEGVIEKLFTNLSTTAPTGLSYQSRFRSPPNSFSLPVAQNVHRHEHDESAEKIDRLLQKKALPEKGKLLQAVIEAGPLLETLLVAGYLPKWRNPPPQLPYQVPSVSLRPPRPSLPSILPRNSSKRQKF